MEKRAKSESKKDKKQSKIQISKEEYDDLKKLSGEKDDIYDKYMRIQADFENALKRLEKEREAFLKYANEGLVIEFLPIVDSLEIAERHIKTAKDFKAVQKGVDMIHTQIQKFLKELGVERIKTLDEKFDPNKHEVIEAVEAEGKDEDVIVEELKPGYMFNGKLLRPAMVKVSKKEEN